ncbi:MAG: hypothetical protein WD360_05095 [Nitriliruptoraceae bacterium]
MSDAGAFLLAVVSGFGMLLLVLEPSAALPAALRQRKSAPRGAFRQVFLTASVLAVLSAMAAASIFGFGPVALLAAMLGAGGGTAASKRMGEQQNRLLRDTWPQLLDTVRVDLTLTQVPLGDALFGAARRLPRPLSSRFVRAEREWVNSVDLSRALAVLASDCDDPFTDVVCESLRTIAQVSARQMNRRLHDVATDLRITVRYAHDAQATLAGARFARRFVVIVPVVMALVGVWVGEGRAAYQTPTGQVVGGIALLVMLACWWWAGRLLKLPEPPRVFATKSLQT